MRTMLRDLYATVIADDLKVLGVVLARWVDEYSVPFLFTLLVGVLLLSTVGCSTVPSFKAADCVRYPKFQGYRVLVCNDDAVNQHCQKVLIKQNAKRDDGLNFATNPYFVRGCAIYRKVGKPTVMVGKMSTGCIPHEIAHIEHPGQAAWVAEHFPCVEDVGR